MGGPGTLGVGGPQRPGSAGPDSILSPPSRDPLGMPGSGRGGLEQPWQDDQRLGGRTGVWGARRTGNSEAKQSWCTGPEGCGRSSKGTALTRKTNFPETFISELFVQSHVFLN